MGPAEEEHRRTVTAVFEDLTRAINLAAGDVLDDLLNAWPVDTGRSKRSWELDPATPSPLPITARLVNDQDYAAFQTVDGAPVLDWLRDRAPDVQRGIAARLRDYP